MAPKESVQCQLGSKYSCSSVISTLEGKENKRRLQTLSIDNAWYNEFFLYYLTLCMLQHASSEVTVITVTNT